MLSLLLRRICSMDKLCHCDGFFVPFVSFNFQIMYPYAYFIEWNQRNAFGSLVFLISFVEHGGAWHIYSDQNTDPSNEALE